MKPDIYNKLAATGRYFNTGKVLIGLQYQRPPRQMGREEERIQAIMLGIRPTPRGFSIVVYLLWIIALFTVIATIAEMLK